MLVHLAISNFVHVDELALDFKGGACAFTGETGAGKSLVLEALKAALGQRIGSDVIRSGASLALVEATFETDDPRISAWRELHGVDELESALDPQGRQGGSTGLTPGARGRARRSVVVLSREISDKGSRCRVDGRLVTAGALRDLGDLLVESCSQHDQVLLARPAQQLEALDAFAGAMAVRAEFDAAYQRLAQVRAELARAEDEAGRRARERDFWAFQVAEIDQARLGPLDEPEGLAAEARVLAHAGALRQAAEDAHATLAEDVRTRLGQAARRIRSASGNDDRLSGPAGRLAEAEALIDDAVNDLRRYAESVEENGERLAEVEARRDVLSRTLRKYGPTVAEALALRERLAGELAAADAGERSIAALAEAARTAREHLVSVASELSSARRAAARELEVALRTQLSELAMGNARLEVRLTPLGGDPGASGAESAEFLFAPNPGEPARPLGKIASGGELSRLMLALKVAMIDAAPVGTLVFDEVDAGVSGSAAQTVARKLADLAGRHQVLLVTHLPAIAAVADHHVRLAKQVETGRTRLVASVLSHDERVRELAHLMSGEGGSKAAAGAAAELLERASEFKGA